MPDIYAQLDAAFASVNAYAILRGGEHVANIAFKLPRDGAGRLYAYIHWFGTPMVRGYASGGGYDKPSGAGAAAAARMAPPTGYDPSTGETVPMDATHPERRAWQVFRDALAEDDGRGWRGALEAAGFTALEAV